MESLKNWLSGTDDALIVVASDVAVILGAALAGFLLFRVVYMALRRGLDTRNAPILKSCVERCAGPGGLFVPLLAAYISLPYTLEEQWLAVTRQLLGIALIITSAWLILRAMRAVDIGLSERLGLDKPDNLDARRIQTQLRVIRAVATLIVVFAAVIGSLATFPQLRQIGTTILASAGVAGIIVGLAAQRVLSNLLAGFQVGFTQPIRLDDVVVVEGEWGRIEEITLTYVVVAIWDQRRLVLPISYFLEKPFQNWTRETAELLGTVFLYVDYTAPVAAIRAELERVVAEEPIWDGRVCKLHVLNATEQTIELRCLVSAKDSGSAFDLRCEVREKMLAYLQEQHPASLPRVRAELTRDESGHYSHNPEPA